MPTSPSPSTLWRRGRSPRSGFTLLELVIVVVIIALLAAFAIPRLQSSRGRAFTASLHSDLRNLASAEEAHYYQHGYYTQDLSRLDVATSSGVTMSVSVADSMGWAATAVHPSADRSTCAVFFGSPASRPAPAMVEGRIACE